MFASSPVEVTPMVRLILDALPKESEYNQDYFIDNLLSALNQVRTGNDRLKVSPTLMLQMDNSMSHNGAKITEKISLKGLGEYSIQPIYQILASVTFGHSEQLKE
jgi:hypothetical protein